MIPKPKAKRAEPAAPASVAAPVKSAVLDIDGNAIQTQVHKMLDTPIFAVKERYWLDTKSPELNATFGSRERGIPYGKVFEISGLEHSGKTLIANLLMGMAQDDGAAAGYIDLEDSRDGAWATKLGVHWNAVTQFYPQLVRQEKGPPKLLGVEEICDRAEKAMYLLHKRAGAKKQFWFLDSVAMMVTGKQVDAGLTEITMNSKLDRAAFLATMLPRWTGLAANYNAMILVSNHLHNKVGKFFGDPYETPGGRALRHVCAVRVRGARAKNGRLMQGKRVIGLASIFRNLKNKSGDGSVEGCEVGFKVRWDKPLAVVQFMNANELRGDE